MANKKIGYIAGKMKELDLCMMSTTGARGVVHTRPMSNNKDVTYKGDSFFFSNMDTRKVKDIQRNAMVTLSFEGPKGLFVIVTGRARLIKSKAKFEEHWVPDLEAWFEKGIDTPGLVLIGVKATQIKYWANYKEGEIDL